MKVAVYHSGSDIRVEERDVPSLNEGEILVKTKVSGICGTDLMEWYRVQKGPRVLGHEITGEIVESKNSKFKKGDRVFVSHHVPCNKCKYCNEDNHTACETLHKGNYDPGGFSEFIRVPKVNADNGTYILPDSMSYEEGSMIEPLACSVRALRLMNIKKNHTVIVMGAGISGLFNVQIAKLYGAKVIATDISDFRLKKAKELGADEVYHPDKLPDIKAEKIVVTTGAMPAFKQAFNQIDKKGLIMFFTVPNQNIELPNLDFWRNELTIVSSYGAAPRDLEESLSLIRDRKVLVKDLITHRFDIDNISKAFDAAKQPGENLKVVINFNQ